MKLDSRIIKGKRPLTCFDTEQAKQFLGKECYFSDHLCTFNELLEAYNYVTADLLISKEKHLYVGELLTVSDSDGSCYEAGINGEAEWFQFCLPCEWVKEPEQKYRPFTPDEFADTFTIGEPIIFRRKQSKRLYEYNVLFIGCCFLGDNTDVVLGNDRFSLETLFNNYEWRQHGSYEWKPFGMEE